MAIFFNWIRNAAYSNLHSGSIRKAFNQFVKLHSRNGEDELVLIGLAYCHQALNNMAGAIKCAKKAVELSDSSLQSLVCLSEMYLDNFSTTDSDVVLKELKARYPDSTYLKAVLLHFNAKTSDSDEFMQQFLSIDLTSVEDVYTLRQISDALMIKREHDLAISILSEEEVSFPNNTLLKSHLARHHINNSNYNEASFRLLEVLRRNPEDHLAKRDFGLLSRRSKNYKQAVISYEDCLSLRPRSPYAWLGLAISFRHLKRYKEAREAAEKALKFSRERTTKIEWMYYEIGFSEWKLGNKQPAVENMLQAIELLPSEYWFHKSLSEIYYSMDENKLGDKHFKISESLTTNNLKRIGINAMFDASDGV